MTPQSASSNDHLNYVVYKDKHGIQRRKYITKCPICHVQKYEQKHRLSNNRLCRKCSILKNSSNKERNLRIGATLRNKYKTDPEFLSKVLAAKVVKRGNEHWNWKGGITPLSQKTRTSSNSNAWKLAVLYRDNYCCRLCNSKDNLHAHHINSWAEFPDDRFILENGLTMCNNCHTQYHNYVKEVRKNFTKFSQKQGEEVTNLGQEHTPDPIP